MKQYTHQDLRCKKTSYNHNKESIVLIILMFIIAKHSLFLPGVLLYFSREVAGEKNVSVQYLKDATDGCVNTILLYWYRASSVK